MALLFIDGFDHYVDSDDLLNKWYYYTSSIFCGSSYARFSPGRGISIYGHTSYLKRIMSSNESTLVVGFALKLLGTPSSAHTSYPFFRLADLDDNDWQLTFYMDSDFTVDVYRGFGDTLLGTSTAVLSGINTWAYLEFKVVINNSTGSVDIKSNEVSKLSLSGIDTQYTTNAYVNGVYIAGTYGFHHNYYDDLYIDNSDFLGELRVRTFNPDGDGTYSQFTPSAGNNYECVDESQPNDDTDYVYSNICGHKDTYTFATGKLGTVKGVQVVNYLRKADSGSRKIKYLCRSNSSDYRGDRRDLNADYRSEIYLWETDPDDSNPWTHTKIEAAEFGLEIATTTTTSSSTTTTTTSSSTTTTTTTP